MHTVTFSLLLAGGLNWLLVGLIGWDIGMLFGGMGALVSRAIYVLVGLSAIYEIISHKKLCRNCNKAGGSAPAQPMQMK